MTSIDARMGDAAAAGRQRHGLTGFDFAAEMQVFQRDAHRGRNVLDAWPLEVLTQAQESWISHGCSPWIDKDGTLITMLPMPGRNAKPLSPIRRDCVLSLDARGNEQ
jgi:hypothetical protein